MIRIREAKDAAVCTYYYTEESVKSVEAAAAWIAGTAALPVMEPAYIMLRDLQNRSDEGNRSCRLEGTAAVQEILDALAGKDLNRIFLIGRYKGCKAGFGVDLHSFELAVTLRNKDADLIGEIEQALGGREDL